MATLPYLSRCVGFNLSFASCRKKRDRDEGKGYKGDAEQGRSTGAAGADRSAEGTAAATASDGCGAATRSSASRGATATPGDDHSCCSGRTDGTTSATRSAQTLSFLTKILLSCRFPPHFITNYLGNKIHFCW